MGMANRSFSAAPPVCSRKNVRESEDQLSQISVFSYDNNGNRVSFRDANNVGQDCVYDARNRDTQCVDTMGSVTKKFYDAHNNLVKTTDALLKDNLCAYDARDRKINCTDRLGGTTQYAYDLNNNLTTLTDAQGSVTSYAFDPRNLLIMETYPDTRSRTYTYDAIRRLIKRVDQTNVATGYVYDHAGRMVERVYPDNLNDAFVFDNASRLTSASSAQYNNVVNRTFDAAGRMTSETLTVGATPYSVGYGYDADNRQTHVIYPNGAIVDRTFTVRNQLQSVAYNGVNAAILNYDNAGRLSTKTFGNGLVETRTYQADNLNTSINTPGVTAFGYTWDANKRKLTQTETGIPTNNQVYTYDNEDRLTGFNRNNGDTQAWTLSLVGDWNQFNNNGVMENRTHNTVHELTAVNATALTYDVKGNLTGNSNGQTYAWDIENRLTTATDNQNNTFGTYTYDALGRRVSKTVGGNTTVFISDGLQKICEYENGTLARAYAYGSYIDEPLVMISGTNKYYYHSNNLYSVAALTDAAGSVIERYKYDPYGKASILAADGTTIRTASLVNNPFMYDGYYHDTETGLEFVNARYYSSDLGRFIARDPIGYEGSKWNLYEYVHARPIFQTDAYGLYTISKSCCCDIEARIADQDAVITLFINWLAGPKGPPPLDFIHQNLKVGGTAGVGSQRTGHEPRCITEAKDEIEADKGLSLIGVNSTFVGFMGGIFSYYGNGFDADAGQRQLSTAWLTNEIARSGLYRAKLKRILATCQATYAGCCGKQWRSISCYGTSECKLSGPPEPDIERGLPASEDEHPESHDSSPSWNPFDRF
jgi:RHS repeat-associated protein